MHQFECIHPYNACKPFDSGLLQKVGVLIVVIEIPLDINMNPIIKITSG